MGTKCGSRSGQRSLSAGVNEGADPRHLIQPAAITGADSPPSKSTAVVNSSEGTVGTDAPAPAHGTQAASPTVAKSQQAPGGKQTDPSIWTLVSEIETSLPTLGLTGLMCQAGHLACFN
jgi:hypothetical protein